MPTTSYTDFTAAARAIANRTDSAGTAVGDISGEEDALIHLLLTEGVFSPDNAYEVNPQSGMTVRIGSQSAKVDTFIIEGSVSGQNPYIARLDDSYIDLTLDASDLNDRLDAIYLVIADDSYDAGGESLPRIGYRRNDSGDTTNPGPDSEWTAYALLAEILVAGGTSSISSGDITDQRSVSEVTITSIDANNHIANQSNPHNVTIEQLDGPRGIVAYAEVSSSQTGIGLSQEALNGLAVTWTPESSRLYRIKGVVTINPDDPPVRAVLSVYTDGSEDQEHQTTVQNNLNHNVVTVEMLVSGQSTQRDNQLYLGIGGIDTGTNGGDMDAGSNAVAFILVEDIGAA